jgi:hypothetical protein
VEMKQILDIENKKDIEIFIKEKYGVALKQEDFPHLNLYNFIEYYIHEFSVKDKETDFLSIFWNCFTITPKCRCNVERFSQFLGRRRQKHEHSSF